MRRVMIVVTLALAGLSPAAAETKPWFPRITVVPDSRPSQPFHPGGNYVPSPERPPCCLDEPPRVIIQQQGPSVPDWLQQAPREDDSYTPPWNRPGWPANVIPPRQ